MHSTDKTGTLAGSAHDRPNPVQILTISIGPEEFGVDIMEVEEILQRPTISPIPGAPNYVEGTVRYGENVVPVVNMRKGFGLEATEGDSQSRVIVVKIEGKLAGMRVDSVNGIVRITQSEIEPTGDISKGVVSPAYIKSIVNFDDRSLGILNLAKTIEIGRLSRSVTDPSG
ncbi:MAG: chemotaxis protein CheW [Candidatus Zixiibacteriota bacterium]